jgi:hypothetical protein
MKKTLSSPNVPQGCSIIVGGIFFVALVFLAVRVLTWPSAGQTVTLTDLSKEHEIYVQAPILQRSGNMYVLYEGILNTNAALELSWGGKDGKRTIPLQSGEISGMYGGPEDWTPNLSVRFVPSGDVRGTLKITAICGRSFTKEERAWHHRLYMEEFNAR